MSKKTLITSSSGQGRQIISLIEAGLNTAGLTPDEAQYLITRGDLLKQEARTLLEHMSVGCPVSCEAAEKLLGENFFGVADWRRHYGVKFTKSQLAEISDFPWSEKILTSACPFHPHLQVKDTHFAFLGIEYLDQKKPLTIRQWQGLCPAAGQPRFYSYPPDCWYANEEFATKTTCGLRWYLLLKEIVPGSTDKPFEEQQCMLSVEYEVPPVVVEVTKSLLCYQKTGTYLNPERVARTSEVASSGDRVDVGAFDAAGLRVDFWWGHARDYSVGLAAARKVGA